MGGPAKIFCDTNPSLLMIALRYTFKKDSRLAELNDTDDQRRAVHPVSVDEERAIDSAKNSADAPGVERIEVIGEDDTVLFDTNDQ